MLVGVLQRLGRLASDPERVLHRQLSLPPNPLPQRLALDEGHGEPEERRRPGAGDLAGIVHREDVGVLQPRGQPDLALEPLRSEGGGELGVEHLEGDGAVVAEVADEVHRRHAAAAELTLESVAVREGGLELRG